VADKDSPDADEVIREANRRMLEAERRADEVELRAMETVEEIEGGRRGSRLQRRSLERRNRLRNRRR
jgi:hypothetical protein